MSTTDDDRSRAAVNLVAGLPDEQGDVLRRRTARRLLRNRALGMLLSVAVGVTAGVLFSHSRRDGGRTARAALPAWREMLSTWLLVVGLVAMVAVLVVAARKGVWSGWRSPLFALSRGQRKALHRQVTGKDPVDGTQLPLAREGARGMLKLPYTAAILVPSVVLLVAQAVDGSVFGWLIPVLVVVPTVFAVLLSLRAARQARHFLERHPEQPTPPTDTAVPA